MKATLGTLTSLALGMLAVTLAGLAWAADEQAVLAAVSRDTGVSVEKLQEEKTTTGFSYGDLRMGHLMAEALKRSFEDVTKHYKDGQPWQEMARASGLTIKDVERIALRRRQASPQP
jgi:hypothetical protein